MKKNTRNVRCMVVDLFVPSDQWTSVLYCRLTDFYTWNELHWQINHFLSKTSSIVLQVHIRNFTSKVITGGTWPTDQDIHRGMAKIRFFDVKAKFQIFLKSQKEGVGIDKLKIEPFKYKLRLDNIIGLIKDPLGWLAGPSPKDEVITKIFRNYGMQYILKVIFLPYLLIFTNSWVY